MKKKLSVITAGVIALAVLGAASPAATPAAAEAPATAASAATGANAVATAEKSTGTTAGKKKRGKWVVRPGVTLANPLNDTRRAINRKIFNTINHTQRGATIRLASWNFDSFAYVDALTAAHRRGVSVQLLMARTMAAAQGGRGPFATLRRNLQGSGNTDRPLGMRSWARTCDHSCRGKGGAMHAKYYIFSKSGRSKKIVMNTSANLTAAAGRGVQWNDMFTAVGRDKTYNQYMKVFREAVRDQPAPFRDYQDGRIYGFWAPLYRHQHPALTMLNQVRCKGAKGAGIKGRTAIRVAQDVFNNKVGLEIALKLRQLHRAGCNVRVVYSQLVGASKSIIKQLPNNHLVQDTDGDGAYDRYLHAKVLSISGVYGKDRGKRIVLNGSANWSGTAVQSDEQGMIIEGEVVERAYGAWINQMFATHLVSAPYNPDLDPDNEETGRRAVLDPYRNMEG